MRNALDVLKVVKNEVLCQDMKPVNGDMFVKMDDVLKVLDRHIVAEFSRQNKKHSELEIEMEESDNDR